MNIQIVPDPDYKNGPDEQDPDCVESDQLDVIDFEPGPDCYDDVRDQDYADALTSWENSYGY